MTHEQHIARFIAYLREQARQNPHMKKDYDKRIAIVQDPYSGYNQPPMHHGARGGLSFEDLKNEALADTERHYLVEYDQEQRMKEQSG